MVLNINLQEKCLHKTLKGNSTWVNKVDVEEISESKIEKTEEMQEYSENKFDNEIEQTDEEPENYISMEM